MKKFTSLCANLCAIISAAVLLCAAPLALVSCGPKEEPVTPTPEPEPEPDPDPDPTPDPVEQLALFSTFTLGDSFDVPLEGSLTLPYRDIKTGDCISIVDRATKQTYTLTCTGASETEGGSFSIPSKYIGGMATVSMSVAGRSVSGLTYINIQDTKEIDKKPGKTAYGRVVDYEGNPIAGVAVSDGVLVTTTDSEGRYYLSSQRYYGYVFISSPSGYSVPVRETVPQYYQNFTSTQSSVYEQHNFVLKPCSDTKHRVMEFTDPHVARRTDDINKYTTYFKPELPKEAAQAAADGVDFFCVSLGDQAWDQYWYDNNFNLGNYKALIADLDIPIYCIPGNHDNDPLIYDDFKAETAFRKYFGPTFFSFNKGGIHYILMDDTVFNNSNGNVQDYKADFTSNQMRWLESDLAVVPAGSTVVFGTHIQYTTRPRSQSDGSFKFFYETIGNNTVSRVELIELFAPFTVHWISGHTHVNYTNRISEKLIEHNTASVCSDWWWIDYYTKGACHLCGDGSPAGYRIFDMEGGDVKWRYKGFDRSADYQFRVYDMNNSQITRAIYLTNNTKASDATFNTYAHGYQTARSDNHLYINVFDYDDLWTITAVEDGKSLPVTRIDADDPLVVVHFNMNRMNSSNTASPNMTFPSVTTSHFFDVAANTSNSPVTITVTDSFGRKYTETVTRPRKLLEMSKSKEY